MLRRVALTIELFCAHLNLGDTDSRCTTKYWFKTFNLSSSKIISNYL